MVKDLKPPVRWLKSYWGDEDILFYFEFDEDGFALARELGNDTGGVPDRQMGR
jgi:hypothetical protein